MEWNKKNDWKSEDVALFVKEYSDRLIRYSFCFVKDSAAAEEIVLDALATFIYRNAEKALNKTYLYRIIRNRSLDYIRVHRKFVPLDDVDVIGDSIEESSEQKERSTILYKCLNKLPKDYRAVLYLHYLEGFSVGDVAKTLSKNKKQVYNLLARGKTSLKELLLKEGFCYEDL
jgi:RNA polymerase sigma-70 factor (ECF subfamily)